MNILIQPDWSGARDSFIPICYLPISSQPMDCPLSATKHKVTFASILMKIELHFIWTQSLHLSKRKFYSCCLCCLPQSFKLCARRTCFSKLCFFIVVVSFLITTRMVTNWCVKLPTGTWACKIRMQILKISPMASTSVWLSSYIGYVFSCKYLWAPKHLLLNVARPTLGKQLFKMTSKDMWGHGIIIKSEDR